MGELLNKFRKFNSSKNIERIVCVDEVVPAGGVSYATISSPPSVPPKSIWITFIFRKNSRFHRFKKRVAFLCFALVTRKNIGGAT